MTSFQLQDTVRIISHKSYYKNYTGQLLKLEGEQVCVKLTRCPNGRLMKVPYEAYYHKESIEKVGEESRKEPMTKVSVWDKKKKGNEKPIEFVELVKQGSSPTTDCPHPSNWDKIMLLCENYKDSGFDLMFAYDNDGKNECLFFGHFNSGKVWV